MKLLVTGGLGFIGSNFIKYWFRNHPKDTIINLDKVTYAADTHNLKALIPAAFSAFDTLSATFCGLFAG